MKNQTHSFKAIAGLALVSTMLVGSQASASDSDNIKFPLVRSAVLGKTCAPYAKGSVRVTPFGNVEVMDVKIEGLPKNTEFDAFVIQVPHAPFGLSWYPGDIQTNSRGKGYARFIGRFNEETFIVAPDVATAPQVHDTDAPDNPQTAPVHTYHIGVWFNSPADALKAGCPGGTTPFNGEHTAGIQILNTGTFADEEGPLLQLKP
ncbi:MAG: hypothetical protein PHY16_10735 [Methylobacter sp.]|nr:hypothetical protein [Methylobacter sp.]